MPKILLIEDDSDLAGMVDSWLTNLHYTIERAGTCKEAKERLAFYEYDLILLDWELPDGSGVSILKEHRNRGQMTPVLMLTGKRDIENKEEGLDAGADDYLTKPFHMKELSARVRALLRRHSGQTSNTLKVKDLELDPVNYKVTKEGKEIRLQKREFSVLEFLMRNQDQVFSPEALLDRVWIADSEASTDALRQCIKRLRKKIDSPGEESIIRNIHGVGYKMDSSS